MSEARSRPPIRRSLRSGFAVGVEGGEASCKLRMIVVGPDKRDKKGTTAHRKHENEQACYIKRPLEKMVAVAGWWWTRARTGLMSCPWAGKGRLRWTLAQTAAMYHTTYRRMFGRRDGGHGYRLEDALVLRRRVRG